MSDNYVHYNNITREILDTIKVGDLVKVNDWETPMKVKAFSNNYFVMTENRDGLTYYSVCCKIPWKGVRHNKMVGGMFHCGTDDYVFGSPLAFAYKNLYGFENLYDFDNEEANQKYLQDFEDGKCRLSERHSVAIYNLYVKAS